MATKKITEEKYNSFLHCATETTDIVVAWTLEFGESMDLAPLHTFHEFVHSEIAESGYVPPFISLDEAIHRFRSAQENGANEQEALKEALQAVACSENSVAKAMEGYNEDAARHAEFLRRWA